MKFKMEHRFEWPVADIVQLLKNGEELCPMDELPNVSSRKIIEQRREGKKIFQRVEWCVHGQIPPIAQKLVSPEKMTFIERSVWDDDESAYRTKIEPHFFRNQLECSTISAWKDDGKGKTVRKFEGELKIKIPVIGPILEGTIVDYLKKNNDKNALIVKRFLNQRLGAPV